ncbi:hypothetical protein [Blastococcus brunescens]|uniref:DUF3040 domain-containing protein n=1 Tax=Blastococcus brunescens TaxID=1564165 RepID=A0ABZ1ATL9_9ACTN|nr:hypothetical protein [Blastococcus sp. BMG 8361]WRL61917.1 hypothetical protein U6N30_17630 [Blastococcus sp. BMG 8361]
MTALTPGCDPDMSVTGAPFGPVSGGGPRLRSGVVLLAAVGVAVLVALTDAVPGLIAVPLLVVGVLCAVALVARGVRLGQRAGSAAASSAARALHRPRPLPTAVP